MNLKLPVGTELRTRHDNDPREAATYVVKRRLESPILSPDGGRLVDSLRVELESRFENVGYLEFREFRDSVPADDEWF